MRVTRIFILLAVASALASSALLAGVSVSTNQPTEKLVALRAFGNEYITTQSGGYFQNPCSADIGSKAKFTLIDLTGGALTDGHQVRIRYKPGNDPTPNYWLEVADGIKRATDGDTFTIRRVDTKCALETPSGRFVGPPTTNGLLSVTSKLQKAMLLELVNLSSLPPGGEMPGNLQDLPTLTVAPSPESSTNPPPATARSAPASPSAP